MAPRNLAVTSLLALSAFFCMPGLAHAQDAAVADDEPTTEAGETAAAEPSTDESITTDGVDPTRAPTLWRFDRAGLLDWTIVIGGALTIAGTRIVGPADEPRWTGGVLFDEDVRDAILPASRETQRDFQGLSDITLTAALSIPMFDATVVAIGYYKDTVLATELAMMNAEVIAVIGVVQQLTGAIASRSRPYTRRCGDDLPANLDSCVNRDRKFSFFSGHTSQSFGAAALSCSQHANIDLYGGGAAEYIPCVAGFALAGFTGFARMMADKHYTTDVLTGAVVGTAIGFTLPHILHYDLDDSLDRSVHLVPNGRGLALGGIF